MGVAEAKRRFSELIDRVGRGERIVVARHGRPVLELVPPGSAGDQDSVPVGLLAGVGVLAADWEAVEADMAAVVSMRSKQRERDVPLP